MIYSQMPYKNYYRSPISIPNKRTYVNPIDGKKTFNLRDMIAKTEKGIDTISSVIPLYQKVKPVIDQGRTLFNNFTTFMSKKQKVNTPEKVDVEIITNTEQNYKKNEEKSEFNYRQNSTSSKPFF